MARSMSAKNGRASNRMHYAGGYYTEGNTVRKIEALPARTRQERQKTGAKRRPARQRVVRTGLSIDLPFLFMLTVAVIATLVICFQYLCLTASIDAHMDQIEALETQLETLKTENDALEQSIDTSVDLNYVYDVAVNELGMIHAGKDNIISYDKTESEYVRQYEDIPKE